MKITTKQLTQTAFLLAVCIVSQFFKNSSVYITGPIINAALILEVLMVGLAGGVILSIITPITAFFITGSPIMAAIPSILPMIMIGNMILVFFVWIFYYKVHFSYHFYAGMAIGSITKAIFMGITIALILLPIFGSNFPAPQLAIIKFTFSVSQLITACIGSIYAAVIWIPLKKTFSNTTTSKKSDS